MRYHPILLLLFVLKISAQDFTSSQQVFLGVGKPEFVEFLSESERNYGVSLFYLNKFTQAFSIGVNYSFGRSNSFPSFYDDSQKRIDFILSQNGYDVHEKTQWFKTNVHTFGPFLDYTFINNLKWYWAIRGSFGGYLIFSKLHAVSDWSQESDGTILTYNSKTEFQDLTGLYSSFGMQIDRKFATNHHIGVEMKFLLAHNGPSNEFDVILTSLPNNYCVSILYGLPINISK